MLKEDKRSDELITVPLTELKGRGRTCYILTVREKMEEVMQEEAASRQTGGTAVRGAS